MTTATLTVRPALASERPAVRDLLRLAYAGYELDFPPGVYRPYLADLLDLDGGGHPTTLVAVVGDRIVGTQRYYPPGGVDMVRLPPDWAWVRAAAVLPDQRRAGIARTLLAESARLARTHAATALSLHTTKLMPATLNLCATLGFHRAPTYDFDGGVHFGLEPGRLEILTYRLDL